MLYPGFDGILVIGPLKIEMREIVSILLHDHELVITLRNRIGEIRVETHERAEEVLRQIHKKFDEQGFVDITSKVKRIF